MKISQMRGIANSRGALQFLGRLRAQFVDQLLGAVQVRLRGLNALVDHALQLGRSVLAQDFLRIDHLLVQHELAPDKGHVGFGLGLFAPALASILDATLLPFAPRRRQSRWAGRPVVPWLACRGAPVSARRRVGYAARRRHGRCAPRPRVLWCHCCSADRGRPQDRPAWRRTSSAWRQSLRDPWRAFRRIASPWDSASCPTPACPGRPPPGY